MKTTLPRILLIALAALLAFSMVGCKSESSPTAPPNTSTVPPGGGVTPPSGATITLTVSNATPLVSSSVVVTATVTSGGANVPDGTAVQFTTTGGIFTDTGTTTTIRTTTGGVAKATLTSSTAAKDTVTATVNNASKSIDVTFTTQPVTPPPPLTAPTISSVCVVTGTTCTTPATGIPAGGQQVIITGTNFRAPVKVLFDPGNGQPAKEAFVTSVTSTQIIAVAPPFDITTGQTLPVTITVIDEVGTANEQKVSLASAFTYQLAILTPVIRALSPTSGPIDGGTRISVIGDGFQAPVQVFFGAAEAQVLKVTFNEIDVMSPTARDTSPNGSATVTGPVDVKVRNVGSGKEVTSAGAFRYIAKMVITGVRPLSGSTLGGTDITIDGVGFTDPVIVTVAGFQAQPIRVSGTQILARTTATGAPCGTATGPVTVTNIDNGDFFSSAQMGIPTSFTFIGVAPVITSVTANVVGTPVPGNTLSVVVQNPGVGPLGNALITFKVGDQTATVTPTSITNGTGSTTFTVVIPSTLTFPGTVAVPAGTSCTLNSIPGFFEFGNGSFGVTFTNTTTSCTATGGPVTVAPPTSPASANPCITPPVATVTQPPSGCADGGSVSVSGGGTGTATITIKNNGVQTLNLGAPAITGANSPDFTISPSTATTVPGG
ncbi:MAG TPA: IPT/TIG domain-containing protein, partial [Thermoanaerobaculia bacterium]|nr:IPT/TIG domain-containing protein [Thermoanaerobaculia bacterium]